jgi:hypothetical protein
MRDSRGDNFELPNDGILAHPLGHERFAPPMCTLRGR